MLSKRDKLLTRPWQQRKYENHRRKVQSALPVIDNRPPACREHVLHKLKKHQREVERCAKIEKDNLTLLRKLSYTMRTSRVDNCWMTPQPNFLNRVPLYQYLPRDSKVIVVEEGTSEAKGQSRKAKCPACTPQKPIDFLIPEERIPWEPEKLPVSTRFRSKSVPVRKAMLLPTITERDIPKTADTKRKPDTAPITRSTSSKPSGKRAFVPLSRTTSGSSSRSGAGKSEQTSKKTSANKSSAKGDECMESPQRVLLSRGSLRLAVNFPSDTIVKLQDGKSERLLLGGDCFCKNVSKVC